MKCLEVNHKFGILLSGALFSHLDHPLPRMGLKGNQNITDTFALIMMIVAPFLPGFSGIGTS